jgi:hypothetical protein
MSWALTRLERFARGSGYSSACILCRKGRGSYILENGLHEPNSSFGRLNEFVFSLFDVKSGRQLCCQLTGLAYLDCSCLAGVAAFNLSRQLS